MWWEAGAWERVRVYLWWELEREGVCMEEGAACMEEAEEEECELR